MTLFSHSDKSFILLEDDGCVLINWGGSLPLFSAFILSHNFLVSLISKPDNDASLSGFDIRETKKLWERMKAENKGKEPPQFMSTHPSSSKRIKDLSEWENSVILDYPPITIS